MIASNMDSSQLHQSLSLHAHHRLSPSPSLPLRTANSTPMSSPGLFSPSASQLHQPTSFSESNTPAPALGRPYLHPLQNHRVRETHKALIDSDIVTGRKSINQYEVIEEIGRGMHGKVKLARNIQTADNVAIKIIPRFSKKRRLGRVTAMSPQDKTKKEIAILKKIRHPNVVALLEVIDDPELKKIYMVLEHVELGEVVWRKKGLPHICLYERKRIEREIRGDARTVEEEQYDQIIERRQALKELKRARLAQNYAGPSDYWSVEYGAADDHGSAGPWSRMPSPAGSPPRSRAPSRSLSSASAGPAPLELDDVVDWTAELETPIPPCASHAALDWVSHTTQRADGHRPRSSSMADSIISHMSSVDYNPRAHDPFSEDFSFVPCFTIDQARSTFRDTVLGLEYLHYQGVVHRDIKPANLLWTRDHRVKISDFGVSYFGRPIRDGELDETVSESEAKDFDDDLELAKTVGTPAFFAPELCYTDVDGKEQPKVSEQIDVWSLGVTLYCLIYARIPFLAEDEFQMFCKIATDEVHISRRRLKPVDPSTSPSATSLYKRQNAHPYRDDNDLEYEDVDNLLYDLLRQILIKNPEKRIRLRDIKRHPWVVQGIANPVAWLDDTDPARPSCGRKIQVDEKDMSFAVVPLNFLERARSVVKKAVGKVMQPLVERSDSKSRRRAASSAASSVGDSVLRHTAPLTDYTKDRRGSLRVDDYFVQASSDGPASADRLAPSTGTDNKAETIEYDPLATVLPSLDKTRDANLIKPEGADKSSLSTPAQQSLRQGDSFKPMHSLFQLKAPPSEPHRPVMLWCGEHRESQFGDKPAGRRAHGGESEGEDSSKSTSGDRALFVSTEKRAHAQVALSNAMAPGSIQGPRRLKATRSADLKRGALEHSTATPSPLSSSPQTATAAYQHGQPRSDPNFHARQQTHVDERPRTAHRVENTSEVKRARLDSHHVLPHKPFAACTATAALERDQAHETCSAAVDIPFPATPGAQQQWFRHSTAPLKGNTMITIKSSSVDSMEAVGTPLTNPSETTSPVPRDVTIKSTSHSMLIFQPDPSLPALLSGASSVSADVEGELLGKPGVVKGRSPRLEAKDTMTPPAPGKDSSSGFGLDHVFTNSPAMESSPLALHLVPVGPESPGTVASLDKSPHPKGEDDGSDDGILLMAKPRKRTALVPGAPPGRPVEAKRRDTGASTASNETAKRVPVHEDDGSLSVA